MQNWFAIESEAEHRQLERERDIAAEAKGDLARAERGRRRPPPFPRGNLPGLEMKRPPMRCKRSSAVRISALFRVDLGKA